MKILVLLLLAAGLTGCVAPLPLPPLPGISVSVGDGPYYYRRPYYRRYYNNYYYRNYDGPRYGRAYYYRRAPAYGYTYRRNYRSYNTYY